MVSHILYQLRVNILIIISLILVSCSNGNNDLPDTDKTPSTIVTTSLISVVFSESMKAQSVKMDFLLHLMMV